MANKERAPVACSRTPALTSGLEAACGMPTSSLEGVDGREDGWRTQIRAVSTLRSRPQHLRLVLNEARVTC